MSRDAQVLAHIEAAEAELGEAKRLLAGREKGMDKGNTFPWAAVPDVLIPDATLVKDHDRGDRSGRRAGEEKIFLDHCIGALRRAWGLPTIRSLERPSTSLIAAHSGDRGSTPNKRALCRLWDWATAPDDPGARERLIDFYVKQRTTEGHQFAEGNTTTHGQLWLGWAGIAHALALDYGDAEMLEHTGEWWRCQAALDDELLDPDGHRTSPNGRSAGASYDLGTIVAHMIRGTAPPEYSLIPSAKGQPRLLIAPSRKGHPGFWADSYNVGACVPGVLIHRGDDLGGATKGERAAVRLRDPLEIRRLGAESVKVVPFARSSEFLYWCANLSERPRLDYDCVETSPSRYEAPHVSGRFPQGKANPFPPPELPNASLVVIPGVK